MLTPEDQARENIDRLLTQSGWAVQDKNAVNLSAERGVAVRELSFKTGEPDYTLFVDGKAIGTVEAKPSGHSLTGVEEQSEKYVKGVPFGIPAWRSPLPFSCESTGTETRFTNRLDPVPRRYASCCRSSIRREPVFFTIYIWPEAILENIYEATPSGARSIFTFCVPFSPCDGLIENLGLFRLNSTSLSRPQFVIRDLVAPSTTLFLRSAPAPNWTMGHVYLPSATSSKVKWRASNRLRLEGAMPQRQPEHSITYFAARSKRSGRYENK
jgi:hypothetical protein